MSHIVVPFGKTAPPREPPKRFLLDTGMTGRLKLFTISGDFILELDGEQIGPTDEKGARARFSSLRDRKPNQPNQQELKSLSPAPEAVKAVSTHLCPNCSVAVSDERIQLTGTVLCPKCTPQAAKPLGVLDFSHKTGGVLMITTNRKHFEMLKRPINRQR